MIENSILPILFVIYILLVIKIQKNFLFLLNLTGKKHQKFTEMSNVPLSGGVILITFFLYSYFAGWINLNLIFFITIFFILGLTADLNFFNNPKIRFITQFFLFIIMVHFLEINLVDLKLKFINNLLENYLLSITFTAFCFTVLLNGSNFIDGNNTLVIGYYILVLIFINFFNFKSTNFINQDFLYNFLLILIILFFFNFFGKLMLGDSGVYLLAIIFGYFLIYLYINNSAISPFFIANMLWYPAFENLFSIVRKNLKRISPFNPDNEHLHQLIFYFLRKKFFQKSFANSLTANLINFFNIFGFIISSKYIYQTKILIFIFLGNVLVYLFTYFYLFYYKRKQFNF